MNNSKVEYKPKLPRVKKAYAFHADVAELIEAHKYENRGRELDFVSQAIRNYCAKIDGEKSLDVLCDRIYKIVSAEVDSQTSRMVHGIAHIALS